MSALISAIIADPKTWFGLFGAALLWLFRQIHLAQITHRNCEIELALTKDRLSKAEGSIKTLTDLFKRETNLG